jgi:elongation factor 1-alpha
VLGVEDDGTAIGLSLPDMSSTLSVFVKRIASVVKVTIYLEWVKPGLNGIMVMVRIQEKIPETVVKDIKVILMGKEGAGKSTLLGVLTTGQVDDGDGAIRMLMTKHKHEIE